MFNGEVCLAGLLLQISCGVAAEVQVGFGVGCSMMCRYERWVTSVFYRLLV